MPQTAAEPEIGDPSPFRAARTARGLTLRSTAERAGISAGQLSRFERGVQGMSVAALYRLAVTLELSELAGWLKPHSQERAS